MTGATNWGRWGAGDQRGMLNVITPTHVVRATRLVQAGIIYPLAVPITRETGYPLRKPLAHRRWVRDDATTSQRTVALDEFTIEAHNFTHMDALNHVSTAGRLYNGFEAFTESSLSIDRVKAIAGRALVADVPRALGVGMLPAGHAISVHELRSALPGQIEPGDAVLVRTGWIRAFLERPEIAEAGWPGLSLAALEWLAEHDVCTVGADNPAVEVKPFESVDRSLIGHERFIRDLGGYFVEFLDLEDVCSDGVTAGFFVMAPLPIRGATGSPVTPLLIC